MDYKKMKIEDIIAWCKENNQVDWLKEIAKKTYPATNKKTGETFERKISFIEIKNEFVAKFMPELAPKATKPKKPSMWDMIDAL